MTEPKEIVFSEDARASLRNGVDKLARAACVTLGPKGRSVGMEASFGAPKITTDGHSIVSDFELKDQYENMGAAMGKEVAEKLKKTTGDGTTTGIVLMRALVNEGVKNVAAGGNPAEIKREIDQAVNDVLTFIDGMATPVDEGKQVETLATVSASGNEEIGKVIAEAISKVGPTGVITIEEGKGTETQIDIVEGMQFDRGYASPYFCTNGETMRVEMDAPQLLITDKKISSAQEILPILKAVSESGQNLVLIADEIDGDALSTLVVNKLRGTLKVCAVKAPAFGDRRKAILEDLAILTGATYVSEDQGVTLKDADPSILGRADRIEVTKDETTLIGGSGDADALMHRIKEIDGAIEHVDSDYETEKLQERRAKLSGGVAIIRVGAHSEPEAKQKKQVFEDSLNSTRAAQNGGYVPGGGIALLRAGQSLKTENNLGAQIVKEALTAPFRQLVENSGHESALYLNELLTQETNVGFNVMTGKVEDLLEAGVIDPALVVKNTLRYASSAAGVILLSEALIGQAESNED